MTLTALLMSAGLCVLERRVASAALLGGAAGTPATSCDISPGSTEDDMVLRTSGSRSERTVTIRRRTKWHSGHWYYDSCDDNEVGFRFPIMSSAQNIGSRQRPLPARDARPGCIAANELPLGGVGLEPGTIECLWDGRARFRGWQRVTTGGATASARVPAVAGL